MRQARRAVRPVRAPAAGVAQERVAQEPVRRALGRSGGLEAAGRWMRCSAHHGPIQIDAFAGAQDS